MNKLQHRFIVFTSIIILVSLAVGYVVSNLLYFVFVKDQVDQRHLRVVEQFAGHIEDNELSVEKAAQFLQSMSAMDYQIAFVHEDGTLFDFGLPFNDDTLTPDMRLLFDDATIYHGMTHLQSPFSVIEHFSNKLENTVGLRIEVEGEKWALFLRSTNESMFSEIHLAFFGFIAAVVVISMIGILFFSRKLIHSLTELTSATREIARNNFDYPLTIVGKDEIGQLADSFRMMQKKLANTDETRRKFINNVSHDFQSPLLNILGYTELLDSEISSTEGKQYNHIIQTEAKRLSNLTKQLLVLTSLDQGTYPLQKQPIRLDEQLRSVVRSMMWRIQEKELEIFMNLQPVEIAGDKSLLLNAWENLLSNAVKYNKKYGLIEITCTQYAHAAKVIIRDTGIGMNEEQRKLAFDRFYRADHARKRDGMGLGLSIVREVLAYHEATITVESDLGAGTTFTVVFPKE